MTNHQQLYARRHIQPFSNSEKVACLPALVKPFASLSKAVEELKKTE